MSELKEPYNTGISTETDRLRQWMVEAASLIGGMPNGCELKEVFDIAYAEARTKYYVDKYPLSDFDIEKQTVKNLLKMEKKLNNN
jgi:hypothetical protein